MIQAPALKKGDAVALIAPSSPTNTQTLEKAIKAVRDKGLLPLVYESSQSAYGHLAGPDVLRAADVMKAFTQPEIKGILCIKGGYGTPRIVDRLDYKLIHQHPKRLIGYSDITALHVAINQKADLITYHGPMPAAGWIEHHDAYTQTYLDWALFDTIKPQVISNPKGEKIQTYTAGQASGILVGGNLSLLVATIGSPYEVDTKGKLLFIEDVGESHYVIDRYLNTLRLAGKFDDAAGIILGTFSNCSPDQKASGHQDLPLDTIFKDIIMPCGKPLISNLRMGHNYPQPTLPLGAYYTLDATQATLTLEAHINKGENQ